MNAALQLLAQLLGRHIAAQVAHTPAPDPGATRIEDTQTPHVCDDLMGRDLVDWVEMRFWRGEYYQ